MTPRKTRAQERIEELDVTPTALIGELEPCRFESIHFFLHHWSEFL